MAEVCCLSCCCCSFYCDEKCLGLISNWPYVAEVMSLGGWDQETVQAVMSDSSSGFKHVNWAALLVITRAYM